MLGSPSNCLPPKCFLLQDYAHQAVADGPLQEPSSLGRYWTCSAPLCTPVPGLVHLVHSLISLRYDCLPVPEFWADWNAPGSVGSAVRPSIRGCLPPLDSMADGARCAALSGWASTHWAVLRAEHRPVSDAQGSGRSAVRRAFQCTLSPTIPCRGESGVPVSRLIWHSSRGHLGVRGPSPTHLLTHPDLPSSPLQYFCHFHRCRCSRPPS